MKIIIKKFFCLPILYLTLLIFSCEKSPTANEPSLFVSKNSFSVAVDEGYNVRITGGSEKYFIKSISDSSVVNAYIRGESYTLDGKRIVVMYGFIIGKKVGSATITFQDSVNTKLQTKVFVTVEAMLADPPSLSLRVGRKKFIWIKGGTLPDSIVSFPNAYIATVTDFHSNSMYINGIAAGSTSITIKDNSNPPNLVTVPITVTPEPTFSIAGKISFSSTLGDFSVEGIYPNNTLANPPVNGNGAGGFILTTLDVNELWMSIIGVKKISASVHSITAILLNKNGYSTGTMSVDTSRTTNNNFAQIIYVPNWENLDDNPVVTYVMYNGTLNLTAFNSQFAAGTFYGNAVKEIFRDTPVKGSDIKISDGSFSVPLITEDMSEIISPRPTKQKQYMHGVRKLLQKQIEKFKKELKQQKQR
ncbi:MAG: hypothetical protein H3C35_04615 [Bacteroidetes bacterium]|nr:hypothetical protein [Bacteroidota bacterium]